ncbi:MAG TPA: hypothetical protein VH916_09865 [Dehalococcoidia bacterium]|jgi:hypothetical protein
MWYTLVRFKDSPQQLKGVAQARTADEALSLLDTWTREFPDHTTVVFDPKDAPVNRKVLVEACASGEAATERSS